VLERDAYYKNTVSMLSEGMGVRQFCKTPRASKTQRGFSQAYQQTALSD
jgi:hypothetical protein